jgi:hypothetical protein
MTKRLILFVTILPLLFTATFASKDDKVAKVIIVRGTVKAISLDGNNFTVKKGSWLKEGTTLESDEKSFLKLLFIDKSQMSLGPSSKLIITAFPKNKAGIITLMKGQLRSKVTKDYMGISNKNKSKLFIKTKTAAMGVRGTDFQVNFNPVNQMTSLITFEGAVAMAQINKAMKAVRSNQASLENLVSGDQSVMVKRGQYSGSGPKQLRVTSPVKINPAQFKLLEQREAPDQVENKRNDKKRAKKFRSTVPPGVDARDFANGSEALDSSMESSVGVREAKKIQKKVKLFQIANKTVADPSGNINGVTGGVTPPAGGYVDTATGYYISPPKGSAYDAQTDTFIPPPSFGRFDTKTGDYINDDYVLTPEGEFIEKQAGPGGLSASDQDSNDTAPPEIPPPPFAACESNDCELPPLQFGDPNLTPSGPSVPIPGSQEQTCQQAGTCPPPANNTGRNVEFIFNE